MALLEASGIGKDFGETHVLKDISLTLEQGEALAIIGSSGSGKTTLLRCLNFLERPDTGVIKVNGETMWDAADPATQRESEVRKKRLHFGLVFQNFNLFPQYTALQNVMLAGELLAKERPDYKANKKAIQKQVAQYQQNSYELERLQALYELDLQYYDYKKTAARVISKDTGGWFQVFYVDKGTDDGVVEGCNVMYGNGLCGIVTEAGKDYAKVRAIIDDTSNVNGMILPSEAICNVEGSASNYENGYLIAENIDKDAEVGDGDQVVTSYVSSKYLSGINIGYVTKIEEDSNNLTKTAYITPACDFSKIQEVLIVLQTKKTVSE